MRCLAPIGTGLQFDFGKFVSPLGNEVIETKDNWNYSRSLLFTLAVPYYHMGMRAIYSPSDKVMLAGSTRTTAPSSVGAIHSIMPGYSDCQASVNTSWRGK